MQILRKYVDSTSISSVACRAISSLTHTGHSDNQTSFSNAGVCYWLVTCLKRHAAEAATGGDASDELAAARYCIKAIASLASDGFETLTGRIKIPDVENTVAYKTTKMLEKEGVCVALISTLKRYLMNEAIAEACCRAIVSLQYLNQALGEADACKGVLAVLNEHTNSEVVSQWGCRAVGSLSLYGRNRRILRVNYACETLAAALQRHVGNESILSVVLMRNTSSAAVALWGCNAMYCLANWEGKVEKKVVAVKTVEGSEVHPAGTADLDVDEGDELEVARLLAAAGACESVAKALVKYSEVETVACACFRAVIALCKGARDSIMRGEGTLVGSPASIQAKLGNLGVCTNVVESMHMFPSSMEVNRVSFHL